MINGIFSGRLNTALHVGTLSPKFVGNMKTLGRLLQRILTLTLVASLVMSIASTALGILVWGLNAASFVDILTVIVATMSMGLAHYLLTLPVTFTIFKKGLDLDSFAYPIAATIADVFITLCYALALNLRFSFGYLGSYAVILIALAPFVLLLFSLPSNVKEEGFYRTIKTSVASLTIVAIIASVAGSILHGIVSNGKVLEIGGPIFLPTLLIAYPAIIELVTDATLVVGSTLTAKLVLGMLEPHFSAVKSHASQILGAWAASAATFVPLSAVSLVLTGTLGLRAFSLLAPVLLAANAFALIAMILISIAFAILTFKRGLDPDHFVIPLESSLAGAIASAALLIALFLFFQR